MSTIEFSQAYVLVSCGPTDSGGCGLDFAMSREFFDQTKRTGETWHCPRGHKRRWTGSTTEQELERANAKATHLADQLHAAGAEAERLRVTLLRDRHRFANGVCPCCNRSFENVARHVRGQHPDYDVTTVAGGLAKFECSCGKTFESLRGLRTHQGHKREAGWAAPNAWR